MKHNITLTDKEVQQIIDALVFANCCDVCMNSDNTTIRDKNMEALKLARDIKSATGVDISENIYILDHAIYEEEEEVEFLKASFNVTES